jgi:tetraacyldisaccharide 4'-kinase
MTSTTQQSALQRVLSSAWTHRGLLAWMLWPAALLYGVAVTLRRRLFKLGVFRVGRVPVPVIVVGNVVVGGSGKTPVVIALVQHLQSGGLQVGVISRGYGRRTSNCQEVLPNSKVREVGDEPALIKRATSASVFVAADRFEAARALLERYPGTQVILCDDGLQHLGLQRDLEICVFDDRGIGNGFLLPAGPLRETWPRAVDLVLHTGAQPAFAGLSAHRELARHARRADGSQIALADLSGSGVKPLLAVAAIAKPEDFFSMLRSQGLTLERTFALPDHDDFESWPDDPYNAYTVLCTEKDAVKLWQRQPDALAIPLLCTPEPAFMAQFNSLLSVLLTPPSKARLSSGDGHTTS